MSHAIQFPGDDTWCGEMVNLICKLREEFNMHSSKIMGSFHRWAATPIPIDEVNGGNWDDVYVRIARYATQRPKTEANNVYTTMFGNLRDEPTAKERKKMIRFVTAAHVDPT